MKSILKWLSYDIGDGDKKNRALNNLDVVFALLYTLITIYLAFSTHYSTAVHDPEGKISQEIIITWLILFSNAFLLVRTYIKLYLQFIEKKEYMEKHLAENKKYDKIVIDAYEKRLRLTKNIFLIVAVVLFFIGWYGDVVIESVAIITSLTACLVLVNDCLDSAIHKYSAVPISGIVTYAERR